MKYIVEYYTDADYTAAFYSSKFKIFSTYDEAREFAEQVVMEWDGAYIHHVTETETVS